MALAFNEAVVKLAKAGNIKKSEVDHNRDVMNLLFRAVSDVNTPWVSWYGKLITVNRGHDWTFSVGSASLMERLAERAARDCMLGLLSSGSLEGALEQDAYAVELLNALDDEVEKSLSSDASTYILLTEPMRTLKGPSLAADSASRSLWTEVPSLMTRYSYNNVQVGPKPILQLLKNSASEFVLSSGQNVRLHMTEIGRKRKRMTYGASMEPLFMSAIRDAGHSWDVRVQTFNRVVQKALAAFCDVEGAFLSTPKIVQSLHRGTIHDYVERLPMPEVVISAAVDRKHFAEYHPVPNAELIKPESIQIADRVEIGYDRKTWCVGHGATHSADVWAAVQASADRVCALDFDRKATMTKIDLLSIVQIDNKAASERPAFESYLLKTSGKVIVILKDEGRRLKLEAGDTVRISLPDDSSWTRVHFRSVDDNQRFSLRFRKPFDAIDVIAPVLVGYDDPSGPFSAPDANYYNALRGWRLLELPLTLYKHNPDSSVFDVNKLKADIVSEVSNSFAGFASVSEDDGRRIAYAAKKLSPLGLPSYYVDRNKIPSCFDREGPAALALPAYAWVRTHDGVLTLCTTHSMGQMLFIFTPLFKLARQYVLDLVYSYVDRRDVKLLNKIQTSFKEDQYCANELHAALVAGAARLITSTIRTTLYYDKKAVDETQHLITRHFQALVLDAQNSM